MFHRKFRQGKMLRNALIVFGIAYLIFVVFLWNTKPRINTNIPVDSAPVDFSVTTIDGKEWNLADYRGKRVVVDMWATWCPPCVLEIPHFQQLSQSHPEIVVIGISGEDPQTIKSFAEAEGVTYPLASSQMMPPPFGLVQAYPTTFFIDKEGKIEDIAVGYHDYSEIQSRAIGR